MPLYRAFALILVKVKDTFRKVLARGALMRTYIIYAPKTDCSLCVLACPSHETAVARDELAVYAVNSLENFVRISCSRQKVLPLFRISAVPDAVLAVPVTVSAIPDAVSAILIAGNAHPAHEHCKKVYRQRLYDRVALFLLEIIGEDTGSTLYLGSTRARLVVLGSAGRGDIAIGSLLVTFDTEDFRTDKTAIVGLGLGKEVLYYLITGGLALAIGTLCLSAVETYEYDDA